MQYKGFDISYNNTVVTVSRRPVPADQFDNHLREAHSILAKFRQSQPGSVWGCDGIGYAIEKEHGNVCVKKSGVGPRKYQQALKELQA